MFPLPLDGVRIRVGVKKKIEAIGNLRARDTVTMFLRKGVGVESI
jgi:hypothetical protein